MRRYLTTGILALLVAMGAAACSDDDPTEPGASTLSAEEAASLAQALAELGFLVYANMEFGEADAVAPGGVHTLRNAFTPQAVAGESGSLTLSVDNVPCPIGGTLSAQITMTGTQFPDEDRFIMEMDGTQTHKACRVMAGQQEFSITGDPNLTWSMRLEMIGDDAVGEQTFEYGGAFLWSTPQGREGRCTIDYALIYDGGTDVLTLEGQFCGVKIDQTIDWSDA